MKAVMMEALEKAGASLQYNFNRALTITTKKNQSIVTNADLESEKIIIEVIRKAFPSHNIISEECGIIDNRSGMTWVIDPLDGTSNFAAGIPWFGILIAALEGDEPVLAGAFLPVQHDLYIAEKGAGSYRNNDRIQATATGDLREMLVAFSTDYTGNNISLDRGMTILKKLIAGSRNMRSTNSLLDFLYVAEGKFGACVNLHTRIWDIAAPALILKEAGGFMTDLEGRDFCLVTAAPDHARNYPVATASLALRESLMALVR